MTPAGAVLMLATSGLMLLAVLVMGYLDRGEQLRDERRERRRRGS